MSARKPKAWVKSAFSDSSLVQATDASSTPRKDEASPAKVRRLMRSTPMGSNSKTTSKKELKEGSDDDDVVIVESENDVKKATGMTLPAGSNWIDAFAPSSSEDLAVHSKKVGEFRDWLRHCEVMHERHPAQICLLTGPSGAGKTATVRVLAAEGQFDIQEWINPIDCEVITTLGDQPFGNYVSSQVDAFKSFLLRASRYKSLLDKYDKRLLLVEDIPNALISDAAAFETILEDYVSYGKSPLVFVVADSKSRALNISYNLFTDQVKSKIRIEHISFNPIAATLMQKAMKRFCELMRARHAEAYKVPTATLVDSIVVCAQGDIRNALINLHFSSLKGAPALLTKFVSSASEQSKTGRGKKKKESTLKSVGRDESITMLHALGRVFNPKYTESNQLLHNPDEIAENYSTEPKKFTDFVFANYLRHFREMEHVLEAANGLSLADLLLCEYRDDTVGLLGVNLAARSVMLANKAPVAGWMPVRGPKRINAKENTSAAERKLLELSAAISPSLYVSEFGGYLKIIASGREVKPVETTTTTPALKD